MNEILNLVNSFKELVEVREKEIDDKIVIIDEKLRELEPYVDNVVNSFSRIIENLINKVGDYTDASVEFDEPIEVEVWYPYYNNNSTIFSSFAYFMRDWIREKTKKIMKVSAIFLKSWNSYKISIHGKIERTYCIIEYDFDPSASIYYKLYILDNLPVIMKILEIFIDRTNRKLSYYVSLLEKFETISKIVSQIMEKDDNDKQSRMRGRIGSVIR